MDQGWERVEPPRTRARPVVGALVAVAVVALLVRVPGGADPATEGPSRTGLPVSETPAPAPAPARTPTITRTPAPDPSPSRDGPRGQVAGSWHAGAPLPGEPPGETAVVWDGADRVFLVMGHTWDEREGRSRHLVEVWAYEIAADAYTRLPDPPLSPRTNVGAAWTGAELVVWGGRGRTALLADGAAYDPAADRWGLLPDGPLSPRFAAVVAPLPGGVVVAGGADHEGPLPDGAMLDLAASHWSSVHEVPFATPDWGTSPRALVQGDSTVVWFPDLWGADTPSLRVTREGWSDLAVPHAAQHGQLAGVSAAADGSLVAVWGHPDSGRGWLVQLAAGAPGWEEVAEVSRAGDWIAGAGFVDETRFVVLHAGGRGALYDMDAGTWAELPRRPAPADDHRLTIVPAPGGFAVLPPTPWGRPGALRFTFERSAAPADDAA